MKEALRAALPLLILAAVLIATPWHTAAVKRHDFKTCEQSGFCKRQRAFATLVTEHPAAVQASDLIAVAWDTLRFDAATATLSWELAARPAGVLIAKMRVCASETVDLAVTEKAPMHPRYDGIAAEALVAEPPAAKGARMEQTPEHATVHVGTAWRATVQRHPFQISLFRSGSSDALVVFNERQLFRFEAYATRRDAGNVTTETDAEPERLRAVFQTHALWEESFAGKTDSKPRGAASIGLDVTFPGAQHLYGLPEHAAPLNLPNTRGAEVPAGFADPLRLYNLDVFEYEMDNGMALYGAVPFAQAQWPSGAAAGVLWVNAAEMWVDVARTPSVQTHWMAESGSVRLLAFLGASPKAVAATMTAATGRQQLPPEFALGNHQCRWNYVDEADCRDVDANFDRAMLPYDVLWLDIEHTDGKRYFTWSPSHFPTPLQLQGNLTRTARKLVTIVDPHLKKDGNFAVSREFSERGLWIKDAAGNDFEGWCWPGTSQWPDFVREDVRAAWAAQFEYARYAGTSPAVYTWNDMNEPSVFTGPEITMPKDCKHANGAVEHRDVHNAYGMLVQAATFAGQLHRQAAVGVAAADRARPFILSRAFFIGTQRYGCIWTGDNSASWEQLRASVPMLLSLSVAGISFAGADVGGFFGNPEPALQARWYQTAIFQPFLRNHAHIDTRRREPYLLEEPFQGIVRAALLERYRLLPMWYTWFWQAAATGAPVMRPLAYEFPTVPSCFGIDDAFMAGAELLVAPVMVDAVDERQVTLPGPGVWFEWDSGARLRRARAPSGQTVAVRTPLEKTPVFARGGAVLSLRERPRRSSPLMRRDPLTVAFFLDETLRAAGEVYLDAGDAYRYLDGEYLLVRWTARPLNDSAVELAASVVHAPAGAARRALGAKIERIRVHGLPAAAIRATVSSASGALLKTTVVPVPASPFIANELIAPSVATTVKLPPWDLGDSAPLPALVVSW